MREKSTKELEKIISSGSYKTLAAQYELIKRKKPDVKTIRKDESN